MVGRPKAGALSDVIHEYETRAARYWPLDIVEVKEERGSSKATPDLIKDAEGGRLLKALTGTPVCVACDPGGRTMDSEAFAAWLQARRDQADNIAFFIGGAYGLSTEVLDKAQIKLSLAPWTLTHDLARLVLMEQLYRAGTIIRGEPYHK